MRGLTQRENSLMWKSLLLEGGRRALLLNYPDMGKERNPDEVNRNLLCINEAGKVQWQVNPPPPRLPSGDPFVALRLEHGKLVATRFGGDICNVDISNGDAVAIEWTK